MNKYLILDWKRTLYDPESKTLIKGTKKLLTYLRKKDITLVLIGKGDRTMYDEVKRLDILSFFSEITFIKDKGKHELFKKYINTKKPEKTIIIGDRVRSEIEAGNKLGATTVWVKQGKFACEEPLTNEQKPTYSVSSLEELMILLKTKLNLLLTPKDK